MAIPIAIALSRGYACCANRLLRFESTEGEMTSAYQSLHLLQQHRRCLEVEAALKDGYGLGRICCQKKG